MEAEAARPDQSSSAVQGFQFFENRTRTAGKNFALCTGNGETREQELLRGFSGAWFYGVPVFPVIIRIFLSLGFGCSGSSLAPAGPSWEKRKFKKRKRETLGKENSEFRKLNPGKE